MGRHIKYPAAKQALLAYYQEHGTPMPPKLFYELLKEEGADVTHSIAMVHKTNYCKSLGIPLEIESLDTGSDYTHKDSPAYRAHLDSRPKCNTIYTGDSFLAEIIWESIHKNWLDYRDSDINKNGAYLSACAHGWSKAKFEDFATFEDVSKTALSIN